MKRYVAAVQKNSKYQQGDNVVIDTGKGRTFTGEVISVSGGLSGHGSPGQDIYTIIRDDNGRRIKVDEWDIVGLV